MKCFYKDCQCLYQKNIGRGQVIQTKPCCECKLYDPQEVRNSSGCTKPVIAIILIIILLLI